MKIYGYKYSTADELAVYLNRIGQAYGLKSVRFVALDKENKTLDGVKVPTSIIIVKGNTKKLSISLPPNLKRVNKFTTKKGEVKISILYNKTLKDVKYLYNIEKVLNDTIKATEKGTDYAYTTVTLPNGDKKVFTTKVTVK